jgi:signal transduction histidine kinase
MSVIAGKPAGDLNAAPFFDPGRDACSILIVEDEYLVALDIKLSLERMGHKPVVTHSAEEALETASRRPFDVVLMDIKLKGRRDGIDTARELHTKQDVPVIYLTAYADSQTLDRARVTEPYAYLLKPFQERELQAAIEMALHRHETDRRRWEQAVLLRFLAEASAQLAATLDYRSIVQDAAMLLVPRHAEWCVIHLDETSDTIPAYTFTHPGGEVPPEARPGSLIESVQQTGHSEMMTEIADVTRAIEALGDHHAESLRAIEASSVICVPLRARHQILGSLAVVSGKGRPRYSVNDLVLIEDFSHRFAVALDNALLYRAAQRAIDMRDDVLAIVSHDLRAPLGTILLYAESLADKPDAAAVGVNITRSAMRMDRLIGDLLDASAINAGRLTLEMKIHNAADIARDAVEMFRSQADARKVALVERIAPEPLMIKCDRDRIVQVLSNLVGNAVKFTQPGGTITVGVERSDNHVGFEVRDTGEGIAPEQVPFLFDRFWRGHTRGKGAGLGLFIAQGITAAHNARLRVDTALGHGSRFYFSLPEVK